MKNLTRKTSFLIAAWVALCMPLLLSGCMGERNHLRRGGKDGEITLILRAPAMDVDNNMRQMSAHQESAVKSLKILVFKTKDAGATLSDQEEKYAYEAKISSVTPQDGGKYYKVVARLKGDDTTTPYRLVLIANHSFDADALAEGMSKAEVFAASGLKKAFTDKWDTNDASATIPMWGESDAKVITEGVTFSDCFDQTGEGKTKIHLIRSLARVDVGISFNADVASEETTPTTDVPLTLESVRVYRYATSFLVPGTQTNTYFRDNGVRKPKPVLPVGVAMAEDTKCLSFTAINDRTSVRDIYIPERLKGSDKSDRPCLVIGGKYNGAAKATYYRLDFIKTPKEGHPKDTEEALDILRNHRYRFNITKVSGPGYDTPEEALSGEPVNIYFDVVVWDEAQVGEVRYDGQYYLAVNKDKFEFGRIEDKDAFTVRTNWEGGYKFVDAEGNELPKTKEQAVAKGMWYYLSDPKDPAFVKDQDFEEKVFVLENATGADRFAAKGSIFVQAGRIKWPLNIKQTNKVKVNIKLYELVGGQRIPTNLVEMTKGETKTVEVEYTPGANLEQRVTDSGAQFIWTRKDDGSVRGKAVYEITADETRIDEDTFNHIAVSRFIADLEGMVASADLTVTLNVYNAIPYRFGDLTFNMLKSTENGYVLDNREQKFFIKANAPYQLIIDSIQTSPKNTKDFQDKVVRGWNAHSNKLVLESVGHLSGDPIRFTPYDYTFGETGINPGDVTIAKISFKIVSTDSQKKFDTKQFNILLASSIIQPTANCYIIKRRAQLPILIPVSEQIIKAAEWYEQFETVMEATVKQRTDAPSGDDNGFSKDQYNKYIDDGASRLTRLEPTDDNWEIACLWSTIDHTGAGPGLTFKKVQIDGFGQRNFMSVAVDPNSDDIGSAVLVVKRPGNDGEILWSWHIWVVDNYPWEPLRSGLASPLPFMNRNLGARYQRADRDPSYDPNQAGMYYQFGRKDPFHPYDKVKGKGVTLYQNTSLRYTNPTINNTLTNPKTIWRLPQHNLQILFNMVSAKSFWRMKDFVRDPSGMGYRAGTFSNSMEWGPWEFRNEAGNAAWQGTTAATTYMETSRRICTNTTIKTPFDPSPYGWKVPAIGSESNYAKSRGFYPAASGCFLKGNIDALEWISNNDRYSAYSVSTRINVRDINPGLHYDYSTSGMDYGMLQSANPSAAIPVRCRVNENELDYKAFTEEGFFQSR